MLDSRVVRKLPVAVFAFLLCLGVLLPAAVFSAQAADTNQPTNQNAAGSNGGSGTSSDNKGANSDDKGNKQDDQKSLPSNLDGECGTCKWEYKTDGANGYIFTISPKNNDEGDLTDDAKWGTDAPAWQAVSNGKEMAAATTSIVIKGTIKTGKNVAGMFKDFKKVTKIDLTNLDTTAATDMSGMFSGCEALTELNAKKELDTSNVTNMSRMFQNCKAIEQLNLNGARWDTSKVTDFKDIFQGCTALKELDISTWSTAGAGATGAADVFKGLIHLQKLAVAHKFSLENTGIEDLFGKHITWSLGGRVSKIFSTAAALKRFHDSKKDLDGAEMYLRTNKRGNWKKDANGRISCEQDNVRLTGWQNLEGTIKDPSSRDEHWFYFDKDGFALIGRHKLLGGLRNDKGETEEHWFLFDKETGAEIRGWAEGEKQGTWYFYRYEDGAGLADGRYQVNGGLDGGKHWFGFDKDGLQIRGWNCIGDKWYYYAPEDGAGLVGQHQREGGKNGGMNWFYFDEETGVEIRGWKEIKYQNKWCYYSKEDGTMLKGQHELEGGKDGGMNWFYFDEETGAEIRGWKEIKYQNKWCYYRDEDGIMLKGQHELEGGDQGGKHWFYFDETTGAELRNCWKEIPSQGKTCYYGSDGAMYKGAHSIDGRDYYFDEITGAVIQ